MRSAMSGLALEKPKSTSSPTTPLSRIKTNQIINIILKIQ
jgi:hypothetical protein